MIYKIATEIFRPLEAGFANPPENLGLTAPFFAVLNTQDKMSENGMSLRAPQTPSLTDAPFSGDRRLSADSPMETDCSLTPSQNASPSPFSPPQTFESFLGNGKHKVILLALREVASRRPDAAPVVLCGETGTGKTHLLHATRAELSQLPDNAPELLSPLDHNPAPDLGRFARTGLLLDDAHLITDTSIQEKLCVIFDHVSKAGAPVAIAGTGPFFSWPLITPLRSRLRMGLVLTMPEPDLDIRLRYLQRQASAEGMNISRETALILARQCADLRRLSGMLRHIALYRRLSGADPSAIDINKLVLGKTEDSTVSHQTIITQVGTQTGIEPKDILGDSRHPEHVFARQLSMFLCRELLGLSYPALGRLFGGKNHSTVIHSCKKIQLLRENDNDTNNLVTELTKLCREEQ